MRSSLSQVSALRDSLNYCLMVSSESGAEISFRKSVLTASIKRFVFTRKYRTLVSFSLRCSRTKVEQEKFQVAAYAAARFFFSLRGERETTNSAYMRLAFFLIHQLL